MSHLRVSPAASSSPERGPQRCDHRCGYKDGCVEKPFNNPFAALKLQTKPGEKKPAPAPPPRPAQRPPATEEDERALFLASVGEVAQVRGPGRVGPQREAPPLPALPLEEDDVLTQLSELVAGEGRLETASADGLLEGAVAGLDRRIVQKLRRGEYPVEASLDLHGLTRAEAQAELERFLSRARRETRRCVRVVHGRGLHSPAAPVLKEGVGRWLSEGRLSRWVLAFTAALPQDGGAGAVYVLLRR